MSEQRHRLLAIDGDDTRIYRSLRVLRRLEAELRTRERDASLTLGQWFDYVGGTNSGGVVAALIALGLPVAEIERRFKASADVVFRQRNRLAWILANGPLALLRGRAPGRSRRRDDLEQLLRQWFAGDDGPLTMRHVHDHVGCHLLLSVYNLTTDSPWWLNTNPDAQFNRADVGSNLDFEMWALARATLARPRDFSPVRIPVVARDPTAFDFADGASAGRSNLSLQLVMMATLAGYEMGWATGPDDLLLVSVGSGVAEHLPELSTRSRRRPTPARLSRREQTAMMLREGSQREDLLCRLLGQVRWAQPPIDLETADAGAETVLGGGELFTYVRYNDLITDAALRRLGVGHVYGADVRRRDRLPKTGGLAEVGDAIATQVDLDHLVGF